MQTFGKDQEVNFTFFVQTRSTEQNKYKLTGYE